jgi:hypothetical protein
MARRPTNKQESSDAILGAFFIPGSFLFIIGEKILVGFRPPVNSAVLAQWTAQGTLKNPRKRARPPRTGEPFSAYDGNRAKNREIAMAPSSRASAIPAH